MNNSTQAKNGFKTFIITFGVSLLIFGFFYYLLSESSVDDVSIESDTAQSNVVRNESPSSTHKEKEVASRDVKQQASNLGTDVTNEAKPVLENTDTVAPKTVGPSKVDSVTAPQVAGVSETRSSSNGVDSPFGELNKQSYDVQSPEVLAGADESTQSTAAVPETGDFTMTLALVTSLGLLGFFVYILFLNPRKYALSKFEEDIRQGL